jgi:hypothetical protein
MHSLRSCIRPGPCSCWRHSTSLSRRRCLRSAPECCPSIDSPQQIESLPLPRALHRPIWMSDAWFHSPSFNAVRSGLEMRALASRTADPRRARHSQIRLIAVRGFSRADWGRTYVSLICVSESTANASVTDPSFRRPHSRRPKLGGFEHHFPEDSALTRRY